jgi:hypothetical protein
MIQAPRQRLPILFLLVLLQRVDAFDGPPRCLWQSNFNSGTHVIRESGVYKLCEDISFGPNAPNPGNQLSDDSFQPDYSQYNPFSFGLGFFSAIAIETSNVTLDLNGFTIEQSKEHALIQRFFAVIELASAPFIPSTGPAMFVGDGETFRSANDVVITGPGTIGRSAHHGVHGNFNSNITIEKVTFVDFEVAAVSLNRVNNLVIRDCDILRNRHDVPVIATFSSAHFILPYLKVLAVQHDYSMTLRGESVRSSDAYNSLKQAIINVYDDVVLEGFINGTRHPMEYSLFNNPFRAIDGPCYAIVVHGKGPAVGDFGEKLDVNRNNTCSNIEISNNSIRNIKCWNNEVPAAVDSDGEADPVVITDARGAVLQFVNAMNPYNKYSLAIDASGRYQGNIISDAQIMVSNAILDGTLADGVPELQVEPNTIPQKIIDWAMDPEAIYTPRYRCNGDSMHHCVKGITVIRVENTAGFEIKDNIIEHVTRTSKKPFDECTDYFATASFENLNEQQLGNIRMISVAAVRGFVVTRNGTEMQESIRDSEIKNNIIRDATSANANVIVGIDIQGFSKEGKSCNISAQIQLGIFILNFSFHSSPLYRTLLIMPNPTVDVIGNYVNLKHGIGKDARDKYIAARFRPQAQMGYQTISDIDERNTFLQDCVKETSSTLRGLLVGPRHRALNENQEDDLEWHIGSAPGCPFMNRKQNL